MSGTLLGFALGVTAVVLLPALVQHRPRDARNPDPVPSPAPRSAGVGRAAYRIAGDVRAIGRGPGAYGRRVARRAVFRAVRRW